MPQAGRLWLRFFARGSQGSRRCGNVMGVPMTQPTADLIIWPRPKDDPGSSELLAREEPMRALAQSQLRDPQAVDEVFQDVALAVVSNSGARPERWGGWLARILQRQVLIYRRKAGRRHRLIARVAERTPPIQFDARHSPLDFLIDKEREGKVREALGRLASADAQILLWKYRDDLKTQDIARKLNLSVSAAEARLHRARGRLREQLLGYEVDDASA